MDEFVDQLLAGEMVCEIQLPRLTQRKVLEDTEGLAPRRSKLGKAMGVMEGLEGRSDAEDESEDEEGRGRYMSRSPSASRSPSPASEEEPEPEYWTEASGDEEDMDVDGDARRGRDVKRRRPVVERERSAAGSDDEGRYISRSPSPAGSDGRYVSRSPTRSPEPDTIEVEHIDGDV